MVGVDVEGEASALGLLELFYGALADGDFGVKAGVAVDGGLGGTGFEGGLHDPGR